MLKLPSMVGALENSILERIVDCMGTLTIDEDVGYFL